MRIREATPEDYKIIAQCMFEAMKEVIYHFLGTAQRNEAIAFLEYFVKRDKNQYSYEHCFVMEEKGEPIAVANVYDGENLYTLRSPIVAYIENFRGSSFVPDDETQPGEYYIDTLSVVSQYRGKGYGTQMLQFLIHYFCKEKGETLGLLVDRDNPQAKKLYQRLGFKKVGDKILARKEMEHLQIYR